MADLLTKLSSKYGCDKSDRNHKYTPKYHKILSRKRNEKFNLLEFGFGQGKSVKMWMEYFPNANIVNIDKMPTLPKDKLILEHAKSGRFNFFSSDQIDISAKSKVFELFKSFYVIIDDASHVPEDQQYTMGACFPFVEPGGWYIIEDLKCKRNHSVRFQTTAEKTLTVLNKYLGTGKFSSNVLTPQQDTYITTNIAKVEIYDKIAFIRKKK